MERYKVLKVIGDGTYGTVSKGLVLETGEFVAIKKMKKKFYSWEECLELREIKCLRKLTHPNIIKLKEVIRVNDDLHLAFEFLDKNLVQLMQESAHELSEDEIRTIIRDTLTGLSYMHKAGVYHRDLKPDNLMVGETVKIIDFGLAREIRSRPPYTDYVSTRWYRAPEVLLHSTYYSWQIDIFAVGCIMAEIYLRRPLFPGTSEADQISKVCSVLGTPSVADWPEGHRLATQLGFAFPQFASTPLSALIPKASQEALAFMADTLQWDPLKRPTAEQCLQHSFFTRTSVPPQLQTSGKSVAISSPHRRSQPSENVMTQPVTSGSEVSRYPAVRPGLAANPSFTALNNSREDASGARGSLMGGRTRTRNDGLGQYAASLIGRQLQPLSQIGLGRHRF